MADVLTPEIMRSMIFHAWGRRQELSLTMSEIEAHVAGECYPLRNSVYESHAALNQENALSPQVKTLLADTVWDLIVEGICRPGARNIEKCPDKFHLTEYGKLAIKQPAGPHDQEGYLKRIDAVGKIDDVIRIYLVESLNSLRQRCFIASAVTLGCASEKLFLLILDAYCNALQNGKEKNDFEKKVMNGPIKSRHDAFMTGEKGRWFNKLFPLVKSDRGNHWAEGMQHALQYAFATLRLLRNQAGHPDLFAGAPENVHHELVYFPNYLKTLYELMDWLRANPLS